MTKAIELSQLGSNIGVVDGNTGIGTDSPATTLHLSSSTATQLTISNTSTSMSDGDTMGTIDFSAGSSNTVNARVAGAVEGTSEAGGDLVFETRADGGSLAEKLRITSGGSVGIGTTSPTGLLHVKSSTSRASVVESTSTNGSYISFADPSTSSYDRVQVGSAGNELVLRTTEVERVRIDSSGNVGIGTINPAAKLDVRGEIRIGGSSTPVLRWRDGGSEYATARISSGGDLFFEVGNAEKLRITSGGLLDVSGGIHVTENVTPTSGRGIEIFETATGVGQISSFDRDGSSWDELRIKSDHLEVFTGSSNKLSARFNPNGSTTLFVNDATKATHLFTTGAANAGSMYLYNASQDIAIQLRTDSDSYFLSGNFGIGTTPASARKLHVKDANSIIKIEGTSTYAQVEFTTGSTASAWIWRNPSSVTSYGGANSLNFYQTENAGYGFFTNGSSSPKLIINGAGKVGIGTNSPLQPLHIKGSPHTFRIERDTATGPGYLDISLSHADASRYGSIYFDADTSGGTSDFIFRHGVSSSYAEKFRIDKTGNYVAFGGAKVYSYGGTSNNNVSFTIDIPFSINYGGGLLIANGWHYGNVGYGASRMSIVSVGPHGLVEKNIQNSTTANGGSWSFSRLSNYTIRVSKVGGTYNAASGWNVAFIGN